MRRRKFIALLGAAAYTIPGHTQQGGKIIRIGFFGASLQSAGMRNNIRIVGGE